MSGRALGVGGWQGHRFIGPRLRVALDKEKSATGGYVLAGRAPVVIAHVPVHADVALVISLQIVVNSGTAVGSQMTTLLAGWIAACPGSAAGSTPFCKSFTGPLRSEPAPDGQLTIGWGEIDASFQIEGGASTVGTLAPSGATQAQATVGDGAEPGDAVATQPIADASVQHQLHRQQQQIARLEAELASSVTVEAASTTAPLKQSSSPPAAVEPVAETIEAATSTASAPWKEAAYDSMRAEVVRLSEELAQKKEVEDKLRVKMQKAETAQHQLEAEIQSDEQARNINSAVASLGMETVAANPSDALRAQMLQIVDNELGEFCVTPVESVPRAVRAELHAAGVPDDNVNATGSAFGKPVDLELEEKDALQESEIVIQMMGMTPSSGWTAKRIYFVVQFYHFAPAVTAVVEIKPATEGHETGQEGVSHNFVNSAANSTQSDIDQNKGPTLSFSVQGNSLLQSDAAHRIPESRRLAAYLCSGALHLEVWDADALIPLGSLKASFGGLLRQGRPSVQSTFELDLRPLNLAGSGEAGKKCCTMQLSVSNNGKMSRDATGLAHALRDSGNVIVGPIVSGVVPKATLQGRSRHRQRAPLFASSASEQQPESCPPVAAISEEERKLARLHRLTVARAAQGQENAGGAAGSGMDIERLERLQNMDMEREHTRDSRITKSLHVSITRRLRLPAHMGRVGFFEFAFENPFSTNLAFTLCFDDDELSIVTDADEWGQLKKLHGLSSPLEHNFMSKGGKQVYLNARETIYIPFALRTFKRAGATGPVEGVLAEVFSEGVPGIPGAELARQREVELTVSSAVPDSLSAPLITLARVQVRATATDQVVAVLHIEVVPQPVVIDARLHFHAARGELMNLQIPIAPHMCPVWREEDHKASSAGHWTVNCTEPTAVVSVEPAGTTRMPDVRLRYRPIDNAIASTFFIVLYRDRHQIHPSGIWQCYVHCYEPQECRPVLGQVKSPNTRIAVPRSLHFGDFCH